MSRVPVVAVDGPGGAGKGTIGQRLALKLGWHYLDSGALYRIVAWLVRENNYRVDDTQTIVNAIEAATIQCLPQPSGDPRLRVNATDVSDAIREESIGDRASILAANGQIRAALLGVQRATRQDPGLIADCRDMGSHVFPDAVLKIYLYAELEIRALRRYNQLKDKGFDASLPALRDAMRERDERDTSRAESPLVAASDALRIDTSEHGIEDVVQRIQEEMRARNMISQIIL